MSSETHGRQPLVFISYTYADRQNPVLRRLIKDLRAASVRVWRDQEEIRWRSPILEQIQNAVAEADFVPLAAQREPLAGLRKWRVITVLTMTIRRQ
jgi:hypothetical protein